MKFNLDKIKPGDILAIRSSTSFGRLIRIVLGSYTNHNALLVKGDDGTWMIGEAVEPCSKLTPLYKYEKAMTNGEAVIRVLRIPSSALVTEELRQKVSDYFVAFLLGIPYPLSVFRMWVFRFVNSLPWKIEGKWCTRLCWIAWTKFIIYIFNRPDGKLKRNPTPRTMENRLIAGVVEDVTNECIIRD